ncbi:protein chibby homolog 1 [Teleopsis dalmanni]|uniref:protein chibby homolog 1 n=1 Tax=Teleopsis dalmanni TaxID=139649 RepID=UPI0018CC89F5|nr:protein chibby homolog 1 [Teleopsis dalmanni]
MPLFNKKFDKVVTPRTGRLNIGVPPMVENFDNYKNISLNLGSKELRFVDGIWIQSTRKSDVDDVLRLNRRVKQLEDENNTANLKIEVLLDLLAENTTELNSMKGKQK